MTLPNSGIITMDMIRAELKRPAGVITLNDADVRKLAGKLSGPISMADLHGKSAISGTEFYITPSGITTRENEWAGFDDSQGLGNIEPTEFEGHFIEMLVDHTNNTVGEETIRFWLTGKLTKRYSAIDFFSMSGIKLARVPRTSSNAESDDQFNVDRSPQTEALWTLIENDNRFYIVGVP